MLEVGEVNVFYGKVQALFDVSLSVREGEIVAMVGTNGAGKSTILKTIAGLLQPESGTITFMNQRTEHLPPHEMVKLGLSLIPEGRHIFPNLTVIENLKLGASFSKSKLKIVADTLDWVYELFPPLKEKEKQRAGTLSGGEQQMLAIARGLMSRPNLLLLDEPSTGLAPFVVSFLFETIGMARKQGITILLVEQNVQRALEIADRGYILETGRATLEGPADQLLTDQRVKKAYLGIA